jgi:hypothetical protein
MSGGGNKAPAQQNVTTTTSNLPEYARPYFERLLQRAEGNLTQEYIPYQGQRIAGFTPAQEQVQQNILGLQNPMQFSVGSALAQQAGQRALGLGQSYIPGQFSPQQVMGQQYAAPSMQAAQTSYNPNLNYFQMQSPQMFGLNQAQQYMSPYIEGAIEPQLREAVHDARRGQLAQDLGAARQGTYGGSRQLLAAMERERNLGQLMNDIRARGYQSAFENAQQQFERDRAARMAADQANLQAALGVQQLGTQTGLQAALANLDADTQARVQNLAAQLQTQGLNAEQALRAALANQQFDFEAQRLGEQSRQFGVQQGLAGLELAGQMGQTLGNLGQFQQNANIQRLRAQAEAAAEQRALQQQYLDQAYADFLRQRDYPMEVLGQYSNLLRGLPMQLNSTQTTYAPPPSMASQILGTGLGALGLYRTLGG